MKIPLSTVHHGGLRSSLVPAGVQPPLSAGQVQQRSHGAPQRQLRPGRKQRLPEEEEPPAAHHLLAAGAQLPDGQRAQQAGAHTEPVGRRAAGVGAQPQPGGDAAQHEHHGRVLGTQQQHQAGAGRIQPQVRSEGRCNSTFWVRRDYRDLSRMEILMARTRLLK